MNNPGVSLTRRMAGPIVALIATITIGTIGYMLMEGWSFDDAFYMTMIAIGTIAPYPRDNARKSALESFVC